MGAIIAGLCGKHLKSVVLELGGMCPLVILPDADLEAAANAALFGSFFKSGQVCMSTKSVLRPPASFGRVLMFSCSMIIVHDSVADEFLSIFRSQVSQLKIGSDASCSMRGLFTSGAASRLQKLVQDAVDGGACITAGALDVEGNVMQPVVLENVTKEMGMCHSLLSPSSHPVTQPDLLYT